MDCPALPGCSWEPLYGRGVALVGLILLAHACDRAADGQGSWDKRDDGSNYAIDLPGRWHLRDGQLASAAAPAVLLCSDLDDTMVGCDEATAAFTRWWHDEGVPAGGRLLYNTGRALDLFEKLLREKGHCMAEPDLLISSIGTRLYMKCVLRRCSPPGSGTHATHLG
jgi:hypothetical protein